MNIFTYGTLMDREIMVKVCGCSTQWVEANLQDFARYRVKGEEYPGIVPRKKDSVNGVLYFNVPTEAVQRLDLFEGELYRRTKVQVHGKDGDARYSAFVYVIKPEYADTLSGEMWDFQEFLKNGKKLFSDCYQGFDDLEQQSGKGS